MPTTGTDGGEEYNGSHDSDDCGTVEIKISTNKGFDDRFQFYRDNYYWYSDSRVLNTTQFEIFTEQSILLHEIDSFIVHPNLRQVWTFNLV